MLPQPCAKPLPILILALALGLPLGAGAGVAATFIDRLKEAHTLIADRQYLEARALLNAEVAPLARQPAQQALLLAAQGTAEAALRNDARAVALVRRALALRQHLPLASQQRLRFLLAQLQLRGGDYAAAAESLETWLQATRLADPEAYWLLASAYLLQDRLDAGLAQLAKAEAVKGEPPETVQRLLLAALLRAGRQVEAAALLRQLLERAPQSADDWRRLAALQRDLGADDQALATMQALHARGWLTRESELLALAHLQLRVGVPYRAAQAVEDALQRGQIAASEGTWLLLIHAWQQAREIAKAHAAARRAERARPDPQFVLLQAQLALQLADWRSALRAADRLLERPDAADGAYRAAAQMVRGIALARLGRWEMARPALAVAAQDERHASQVLAWLDYVEQMIALPRPDDG
jgi:lipopolysaccharide biosynthesis regulator YciM